MTTDRRTLPKVELHCHLLGVLSPALLARIRDDGGSILVEPEALQTVYPVSNLSAFQRWLEVTKPYQAASPESMRPILASHVANLVAQQVVYTEIMLSPTMFPRGPADMRRAFERWREWTFVLEDGRIQVEYLLVIPRRLEAAALERDVTACLALHRAGLIVGVALVGVEDGASIARFAGAFTRWRDAGLGIEIHAGEHSGPETVREALAPGRAHRIGHGLSAFRDRTLLDEIHDAKVHLEFCPTSNLCTGAVTDILAHPIRRAHEMGLSYSINTDDPGAFGCSPGSEFRLIQETFEFDGADFDSVFRNSLAARFQPKLRYLRETRGAAPARVGG